jgi:hypothetical protein
VKKPVDPKRQIALLKRINSPVIVPANDTRRADAAVRAWINNVFRYYNIGQTSPDRWKRVFWFLALRAFPDFRLIQSAPVGRQKATAQRAELLIEFERYRTRERGSKYKQFLADHAVACAAAGIKTINGLKAAMIKARRERKIERAIKAIQAQAQRNLAGQPAAQSTPSPLELFLARMSLRGLSDPG